MNLLYLDTFAGISGDMFLGLLVDLGVDREALAQALARLPIEPVVLLAERESRLGVQGTRVRVEVPESRHSRTWREIDSLLAESTLHPTDRDLARRIFRRIAVAEAAVHGVPAEEVHFHEVGALDSIADVVGAAVGLHQLGVDRVICSPLPMSRGLTETAHGPFPLPAPATMELVRGLPVNDAGSNRELVTPTGAAIVAEIASFEPWPPMTVQRIGYGVGTRDLPDRPNLLRGVVGETAAWSLETDRITVLESHVDDGNPECLGYLMERLLAEGALDVTFSPLQMKKNRPATRITVLAAPERAAALAGQLLHESSASGVRWHDAARYKLSRRADRVETPWGPAEVKLFFAGEKLVRVAPEFESCRLLAEQTGRPLPDIYRAVENAAAIFFPETDGPCGD